MNINVPALIFQIETFERYQQTMLYPVNERLKFSFIYFRYIIALSKKSTANLISYAVRRNKSHSFALKKLSEEAFGDEDVNSEESGDDESGEEEDDNTEEEEEEENDEDEDEDDD
jgi:hypothetical protein